MHVRPRIPVKAYLINYTTTPVTHAGGWVSIDTNLPVGCQEIEVFDSSGQIMRLGVGPIGNIVALNHYITPGGNTKPIAIMLSAGTALSIEAPIADANAGYLILNLYQ